MVLTYSKEEFMLLGLQLSGFSYRTIEKNCYATNLSRFKDNYYVTPDTCELLFVDIQSDACKAKVSKPCPRYLLLALYFLKKYPTKHQMAAFLDGSEKTMLTQSRKYVDAFQGLKEKKIVWIFDNDETLQEKFIVSVDGVHCRIQEP